MRTTIAVVLAAFAWCMTSLAASDVQAGKAVRSYVHSKHPDLEELPKHTYHARYEAYKSALQDDAKLIELQAAVVGWTVPTVQRLTG